MSKTTWSISELAREFGITTRSIRFYEDEGLLHPQRQGQTRIYSRQDRVRLKLTLRGKRLGFSLAETRELFSLYDGASSNNDRQLTEMIGKVHEKLHMLAEQLEDLKVVQTELQQAEQRCWESLSEAGREALTATLNEQAKRPPSEPLLAAPEE